jgi:hypothetical protein
MKHITVNFTNFWGGFDSHDNFLLDILKKYYDVEFSENPQYIFCASHGYDFLNYDGIRIYFTGENRSPDFCLYDYAIGFDYIDFGDRYMRFPLPAMQKEFGIDYRRMEEKHLKVDEFLQKKSDFCSFTVSKSGYADKRREDFFYKLSEYKKVDSGGRFLNNIGQPEGVKDKHAFQLSHKFDLAFENSSYPGYATEKIVQAFAAGTVPIYWGDPLIEREYNGKAFINCHNFPDFDAVIEEIKRVDQDDARYRSMLEEPALVNTNQRMIHNQNLEAFIFHIIDQDYESAFRRDRVSFGQMKNDEFKAMYRWYMNPVSEGVRVRLERFYRIMKKEMP